MIPALLFWPRTAASVVVRRPSAWLLGLIWLGVMWSSTPPGIGQRDPLGGWWTLGLATPGWFTRELVVFHLVVVTDVLLAARAAGLLTCATLVVGQRRWLLSVAAAAAAGAAVHVAGWCAVTTLKAAYYGREMVWSLAADPDRRLPGDPSGVLSTVVVLGAAVAALTVVSLLAAAVVHVVSPTPAVIALVAAWCVIEIPLTIAELGLNLARFVDPAVLVSPDAVLFMVARPERAAMAAATLGMWLVVVAVAIGGPRRSRALVTPT